MASRVDIKSAVERGLSGKVSVCGEDYIVSTETIGGRTPAIVTSFYRNGEVVDSYETRPDTHPSEMTDLHLEELVHEHHERSVEAFKAARKKDAMGPAQYINIAMSLAKRRKKAEARSVLAEALERFPKNPFVLSYFGLAQADGGKDARRGLADCKEAIESVKRVVNYDVELVYPTLFLNLGRAYMAAGDRDKAVRTFIGVLSVTGGNAEIEAEMMRIGVRRRPVFGFLPRSNPLNKYLGMLTYALGARAVVREA